jgi:hypothetical protein
MTSRYNFYQTTDTSGNIAPYLNSMIEFGYFNQPVGASESKNGEVYSLNTNLFTNNGIASLDDRIPNPNESGGYIYGLKLNSAGIYKITLNCNPTYSGTTGKSGYFSYAFSTEYMYGATDLTDSGLFGGYASVNTFAFDPIGQIIDGNQSTINGNDPGIIFWNNGIFTSAFTSEDVLYQPFRIAFGGSNDGYLFGNFPTYVNNNKQEYPFLMTGEMVFTTSQPTTIYFNMFFDFDTYLPNCYFTLQLLSTDCFQNYIS